MKTLIIILALLVLAYFLWFSLLGYNSRSGKAPGLDAGRLARCPDKPNCVCSEWVADSAHYIEPILLENKADAQTLELLAQAIQRLGGHIENQSDTYLAASFSSRLFGFVDDLEARIDAEQGLLHLRSSSRVGRSDLGANRKRVESVKKAFATSIAATP